MATLCLEIMLFSANLTHIITSILIITSTSSRDLMAMWFSTTMTLSTKITQPLTDLIQFLLESCMIPPSMAMILMPTTQMLTSHPHHTITPHTTLETMSHLTTSVRPIIPTTIHQSWPTRILTAASTQKLAVTLVEYPSFTEEASKRNLSFLEQLHSILDSF